MICELAVAMCVAPAQLWDEDDETIATLIDVLAEQAEQQ